MALCESRADSLSQAHRVTSSLLVVLLLPPSVLISIRLPSPLSLSLCPFLSSFLHPPSQTQGPQSLTSASSSWSLLSSDQRLFRINCPIPGLFPDRLPI
ncbi:hypothetical protein SAY87_015853 [Trapa incisa]|uniref:Uncharacterized protein n=1 Tax=Trapa incisa TaxID=236973 RepID=A0AAN7QUZ4_9MYRT|nr:hypothetical protein SAY87_015853 [Trapa incisa]